MTERDNPTPNARLRPLVVLAESAYVRLRPLVVLALVLAVVTLLPPPSPASAQSGDFFINTTRWVHPLQTFHCVAEGQPCTLAAAIELGSRAGGSGTISACFEEGNPRCLQTDDPNYDPATGVWTLQLGDEFGGFQITNDGLSIDFTLNVENWSGPQDNRIAIDVVPSVFHAFIIHSSDNQLAGFELKGEFATSAILVRTQEDVDLAAGNLLGPGLILAELEQGVGIWMRGSGVEDNVIFGNWFGVRGDGTEVVELPEYSVELAEGANNNMIGGPEPGDRNVFGGATAAAIQIGDAASRDNVIQGNYIGTDATGLAAAPNEAGINIVRQAQATKVLDNLISGNRINGILADNTSTEFGRLITRIENNWIGVDKDGQRPLPNGACGIEIRSLSKNVFIKSNRIWHNTLCGVTITGENAQDNTITENSVSYNAGRAIEVVRGANGGVEPPVITMADPGRIRGTACAGCTIEIFSDPIREAQIYEGSTVANDSGVWEFETDAFAFLVITATSTDDTNTSSLSEEKLIRPQIDTPTPPVDPRTPTPGPGSPTATTTTEVLMNIFLPYANNRDR